MRKSMLAAIMAASALIPAAAMAQEGNDRPHREEGQGQREGRPQRPAMVGDAGRPQWRRPEGQPAGQAPAARPPAPQSQAQPQAQPQPQQPQAPRWSGRDDRGGRPNGQGGRPGFRPDFGNDRGDRPQGQPPQQPGGRPFDGRPGFNGGPNGGRPAFDGAQPGRDPRYGGGAQPGRGDPRGNDGRGGDWRGDRHDGRPGYNNGWNNNGNRGWNRDWRRDNRYNYNYYRNQNRNLYHLPRYYAPAGWGYGYRRFSIGFTLNSFLYDQDYWIDDADYYRLPPAYGPYRWVRYYNDALLVDIRTGYVVDTVYDIFW